MSVAVHYVADGPEDGEPVVLAGSIGSDLRMWEPQVRPLTAAGYRVIRYDHRGHGRSPVPPGGYSLAELGEDAVVLLDRLDIPAAHFAGVSLGGMVGMWLGAQYPDRVRSLGLCCTSADLGPREMWAQRAEQVRAEGMGRVADATVGRWFTTEWRADNPERLALFREMIAGTSAEGYAGCCTAIETMDLVPALATIAVPTLVIAGADDPATPPEYGRRIADGVPGARLEIVEQAAHLGNVERPERFSELLLGNLEAAHA